ncbi:MAG: hypothetical protein ACPLRU_06060 [Desulfofundulus sp.]|uniref:hypothetical protein n=1 Tax=Desulfofundulus sp. TaxID=2282750 RepID=UPI003C743AD1
MSDLTKAKKYLKEVVRNAYFDWDNPARDVSANQLLLILVRSFGLTLEDARKVLLETAQEEGWGMIRRPFNRELALMDNVCGEEGEKRILNWYLLDGEGNVIVSFYRTAGSILPAKS